MCPIKSLMTVFLPYILQDERQEDKQQVLIPVMQQELQQRRFSPAATRGRLRVGRQLLRLPRWVRRAERFTPLKVKHSKKKSSRSHLVIYLDFQTRSQKSWFRGESYSQKPSAQQWEAQQKQSCEACDIKWEFNGHDLFLYSLYNNIYFQRKTASTLRWSCFTWYSRRSFF